MPTNRELIYSPEDDTRASPFFWAFRKAYPTNADQIFSITDSIPAPIKEVGPAFQQIDFSAPMARGRVTSSESKIDVHHRRLTGQTPGFLVAHAIPQQYSSFGGADQRRGLAPLQLAAGSGSDAPNGFTNVETM